MHIVFFVLHFPANGKPIGDAAGAVGGAGNYVANMAKIICEHGHAVDVIVEGENDGSFDWNGVCVHNVFVKTPWKDNKKKWPVWKKLLKNYLRTRAFYNKAMELHKKHPIDIVQAQNSYGYAVKKIRGVPYIIRFSDYPALWSGAACEKFNFKKSLNSHRLDEEFSFLALKKAKAVVVPSNMVANLLLKRNIKNISVVESPVVIDNKDLLPLNEPELEANKYLLDFGALTHRKQILMMMLLIDRILDLNPDMKFVFVGNNKLLPIGRQYIKISDCLKNFVVRHNDRCVFYNVISDRPRLFSLIKNSYACVLPTRVDNLPNAVLESMALGKIVVSTTSEYGTSVEQLITDGYNGFLAQVDDEESLFSDSCCYPW